MLFAHTSPQQGRLLKLLSPLARLLCMLRVFTPFSKENHKNGLEISSNFYRHTVAPGNDYCAEDARVKAICAATHTNDVIAAHKAKLAEQQIPAA